MSLDEEDSLAAIVCVPKEAEEVETTESVE
jgi:hypothetical protein